MIRRHLYHRLRPLLSSLPAPVGAVALMPFAPSAEERADLLSSMLLWANQSALAAAVSKGQESAKGFARDLLSEIPQLREQLSSTPHLGYLEPLSPLKASRFDYVALNLGVLLQLKESFASLGLGSKYQNIRYKKKELTGLEVTQALAILLSAGHLFGTFATERGVTYELDESPDLRREVLLPLPELLRPWASAILEQRNPYRLFYVSSALLVEELPCTPTMRNTLRELLLTFDAKPAETPRGVQWAFRKSRQITYHYMHALLGLGFSFEKHTYDGLVHLLRDSDAFAFDPSNPPSHLENALDAIDRLQTDAIFTTPEAAALSLRHLRAFRQWWTARQDSAPERIRALRRRPADWPSAPENATLRHFCRLQLPRGGMHWTSEVRTWRANRAAWQGGTSFLLTPMPTRPKDPDVLLLDLYYSSEFQIEASLHVAKLLAAKNHASWLHQEVDPTHVLLWRSIANFGISLLRTALRGEFTVLLEPVSGNHGHVGYAIACEGLEPGRSKVNEIAEQLTDETRRAELIAVAALRHQFWRADAGAWLLFVGRLRIVGREDQNTVAEIDGLWLDFLPGALRWTAIEHKSGRGRKRQAQLENLDNFFSVVGTQTRLLTLPALGDVAIREFTVGRPPELSNSELNPTALRAAG